MLFSVEGRLDNVVGNAMEPAGIIVALISDSGFVVLWHVTSASIPN
jgi:hypothetical protein